MKVKNIYFAFNSVKSFTIKPLRSPYHRLNFNVFYSVFLIFIQTYIKSSRTYIILLLSIERIKIVFKLNLSELSDVRGGHIF